MKYLKRNFLAKSWIWNIELKERLRGKVFWVKALKERELYIAMMGIAWMKVMRVCLFIEGRVRKSGIKFLSPLMCWTVKSYLVNQAFKLSSYLSGSNLFLKSRIFRKEKLSILIRKLWLIKWNSNFLIPHLTTKISL